MKDALSVFVFGAGLLIGGLYGVMHGKAVERDIIANECRTAQAFTLRRTGFECKVMK